MKIMMIVAVAVAVAVESQRLRGSMLECNVDERERLRCWN